MTPHTASTRGMWRFFDRLPVEQSANIVSLGEGDTPLLDMSHTLGRELGIAGLFLKAEDRNPTGSFKARIASVAASLVRERGLLGLVGTSSGNGGAAASAYAAATGSRVVLFTLADTIDMKMLEITATGGTAYRVDGIGHDATSTRGVADLIAAAAERNGHYPMLTGYHYAPEAMTGVETIAYELVEAQPELTAIYAPVGGGGLLTGLHRGFEHEQAAGRTAMPRIVGVHPRGATALPLALGGTLDGMADRVTTTISGLQLAVLFDTEGACRAVRESGGHATSVSDDEVWAAQSLLAGSYGLLVEPAGATALAGLLSDAKSGKLTPDDRVTVVLTGAGYKDTAALERMAATRDVPAIAAADVSAVLSELKPDAPMSMRP